MRQPQANAIALTAGPSGAAGSGVSAAAQLVVEHDDAAGGVVRDVRGHGLPFGGATPGAQRRRIVEVSLEHAEVRRLAPTRRDVEAVPVAAQARHLRHQRDMRGLVVVAKVVRIGGRRIQNEKPMHAAAPDPNPGPRLSRSSQAFAAPLNRPRRTHQHTSPGSAPPCAHATYLRTNAGAACSTATPARCRFEANTAAGPVLLAGCRFSRAKRHSMSGGASASNRGFGGWMSPLPHSRERRSPGQRPGRATSSETRMSPVPSADADPTATVVTRGTDALSDAYAKLGWATKLDNDIKRRFADFAMPDGGDEASFGIHLREYPRPAGLVVARFIVKEPMPVELRLLAADLVHNTRVALDYVLARLKDQFGGDAGHGSFPVWQTKDAWREKVERVRTSSLDGLAGPAVDLVYREQPLHRQSPGEDPLVILNKLDNVDKHRLMHPAFVYMGADEGLDLIEILDRRKVRSAESLWRAGQPLENGSNLARLMIRGDFRETIRVRPEAQLSVASGEVGAPRATYTEIIARVRGVADGAAALIDRTLENEAAAAHR
jgi:hypothetical protein